MRNVRFYTGPTSFFAEAIKNAGTRLKKIEKTKRAGSAAVARLLSRNQVSRSQLALIECDGTRELIVSPDRLSLSPGFHLTL